MNFIIRSVFIVIATFIVSSSLQAKESDKIKIGAILALTGDAASFGVAVQNGINLALERLDPEERKKFEVVFEDDRAESSLSVSAFKRLVDIEKVDVVINTSSGTGKALSQIAEQKKVPLIAVASDKEIVENKKYVVNLWVMPEIEAVITVKEALKRGYKKIARISAIHEFAFACANEFDKASKDEIEVVIDEQYQRTERDFRAFLTKVKKVKDLDAIFANVFLGQVGIFAKQTREMGIELPLFAFEFFEDPNEIRLSQGALHDQWYVQADDPESFFLDMYNKKFPDAPVYAAANGYDAIMLIAKAVKENGMSTEAINKELHTVTDFTGALGTYSASGDNRFTLPAAIKVVTKDGGVKKIS